MKNYFKIGVLLLVLGLISFVFSVNAQENQGKPGDSSLIMYKPPMRGAPSNRLGGGTRGVKNELPLISVLAPNHTGLTTENQPTLYWYISDIPSKRLVFTLNDEDSGKTLIHKEITNITKPGIQALNLADYQLSLLPEKEYSWFITMSVDPNQPSNDIYSGANIRLTEKSKVLSEKLNAAAKKDIPAIYAQEGIWYDTLASISNLISENPADKNLLETRASLLEQVELIEIAKAENAASK